MSTIDKKKLYTMLSHAADLWIENKSLLTNIDSRFGDGDHGVAMVKIAEQIRTSLDSWLEQTIEYFLEELGAEIMRIGGGSSGPLYGTMIGTLGDPLAEEHEIDGPMLKKMFAASLTAMEEISTAKIGDKTMMDAFIPAVMAAEDASDDIPAILAAASKAADAGVKATESQVAKFGRARSYGDKTVGTPDAGAVSTALFFRGLMEGYEKAI